MKQYYDVFDSLFQASNPQLFSYLHVLKNYELSYRQMILKQIYSCLSGYNRSFHNASQLTSWLDYGITSCMMEHGSYSELLLLF